MLLRAGWPPCALLVVLAVACSASSPATTPRHLHPDLRQRRRASRRQPRLRLSRGRDGSQRSPLLLNENALQSIADITGGSYHRAADANELFNVFCALPGEIRLEREQVDVSFAFAALGALLATAAVGLSLAWNRYE